PESPTIIGCSQSEHFTVSSISGLAVLNIFWSLQPSHAFDPYFITSDGHKGTASNTYVLMQSFSRMSRRPQKSLSLTKYVYSSPRNCSSPFALFVSCPGQQRLGPSSL
ncbi:unnamed protein product, partial [Choristocarpus tenellus]